MLLFAGATPANLQQQQHTNTVLSWPASSRPVAVPWHDTHPTARRLVPCRLRHHSCCLCTHAHPQQRRPAARLPRLIAAATAAAAFTFARGIRKLPMALRRRAVSLQKLPVREHSQVIRKPYAKSGPDPLNTVALYR